MQLSEVFEQLYVLKGKEYEFYKTGLPATALEHLNLLCRLFERSSEDVSLEMTSRVVPEISFLFLRFCESMATEALRSRDEQFVIRGLESLAIEDCRFDYRDSTLALALLYHIAMKVGANAERLIRFVTTLAMNPAKEKLFTPFLARTPENRELAKFGMREATGPDGEISYVSLFDL